MPKRAAIRRAVSSRRAVISRYDCLACSTIAGGALSGVPLLKGGSGRINHVELNGLRGVTG